MTNKLAFFIFLIASSIITYSCKRSNEPLLLEKGWHFRFGDEMKWASPDFNEKKWDTIGVGHPSSGKIFKNHYGYGWFRFRFNLSKELINNKVEENQDSVILYFGAIDDCDEVYLNGLLVGTNNRTLPNGAKSDPDFTKAGGLWNVPRKYTLSVNDPRLKLGKENVIAVRVFNGYGEGGIYAEIPQIRAYGLADYLFIDHNDFYKINDNGYVNREIILRNRSSILSVRGDFHITATNMETKEEVLNSSSAIELKPGEVRPLFIKLPISTDPLNIAIFLNDLNSDQVISLQDSIPYVLTP